MKTIIVYTLLLISLLLTACGGGTESADQPNDADQAVAPTPTKLVLATPTPIPPPPTPTPKLPTPLPSPQILETDLPAPDEEAAADPAEATEAESASEPVPSALQDDMVEIPAGPVTIGQDNSKPKNSPAFVVEVPAFEIDRFEVTNDEFATFTEATGYVTYAEENSSRNWRDAAEGKGNHPVVYVTWNDAVAFCDWAGKRLPSEIEWEKAARGDEARIYPWGNEFNPEYGNFKERGIRGTTAVGSFPEGASPYGVEDMAGNVREWVADYLLPYEGQDPNADPYFGETYRVHRGGGWFDEESSEILTTYNRNAGPPETSANDDIGFRCARDL